MDLQPRPITVFELSIKDMHLYPGNYFVRFSIECGKGTYIRTICHDVGAAVGVPAHMRSLVRTCSGPFSLAEAHSLEETAVDGWSLVLPSDAAVRHFPALHLDAEQMTAVQHGQRLNCLRRDLHPAAGAQDRLVRVYAPEGRLCALYEIGESAENSLALRAKKVFCDAR